MKKKYQPKKYTNDQLLTNLERHVIKEELSKYSMSNPVWETIAHRTKSDKDLKAAVDVILAQADKIWEKRAKENLHNNNFQNPLFNLIVKNKKSFRDHATIELNEKLDRLLDEND